MDLSLWGWVSSMDPRRQVKEAFSECPPKGADSSAPLALCCKAGCPQAVSYCGGSWEHHGWVCELLLCPVLRCAGHCATGVWGWRQEDCLSALLPLR